MKLCVQDLAAYNEGRLIFEWVDLSDGFFALEDARDKVLLRGESTCDLAKKGLCTHEEWHYPDHEQFPGYSEYLADSDIQSICELMEDDKDDDIVKAYLTFIDDIGGEPTKHHLEASFRGVWDSKEEFASQEFDDIYLHSIPDLLQSYIDYDKVTRDMFQHGPYFEVKLEGLSYIFDGDA